MKTDEVDSKTIEHMHASLAVEQAFLSSENTRVGAVLARGEDVLVTGYRGERGGLHAEQVVLEKAKEEKIDLRRSHMYVTLEPCANSRTSRIPCASLIAEAGISTVHIGQYDPNPQIYRLGWKHLRDHGVILRDFPSDLRAKARDVNVNFTKVFTSGSGMSAGAKFDFTQNGGRFTISVEELPNSPAWETQWSNKGASSIYFYGGHPGVVAAARYANDFKEIDDPDALDYGGHVVSLDIGDIGVLRNPHGHVLCKVIAIEPTVEYGGGEHVSVKIKWEIRLAEELVE